MPLGTCINIQHHASGHLHRQHHASGHLHRQHHASGHLRRYSTPCLWALASILNTMPLGTCINIQHHASGHLHRQHHASGHLHRQHHASGHLRRYSTPCLWALASILNTMPLGTCVNIQYHASDTCVNVQHHASGTCVNVQHHASGTCVNIQHHASGTCVNIQHHASGTCVNIQHHASGHLHQYSLRQTCGDTFHRIKNLDPDESLPSASWWCSLVPRLIFPDFYHLQYEGDGYKYLFLFFDQPKLCYYACT